MTLILYSSSIVHLQNEIVTIPLRLTCPMWCQKLPESKRPANVVHVWSNFRFKYIDLIPNLIPLIPSLQLGFDEQHLQVDVRWVEEWYQNANIFHKTGSHFQIISTPLMTNWIKFIARFVCE